MPLELNKEQLAAADFLNGICVVVAVPGSGKTLTMTHRIGNLVKKHGIAPENIFPESGYGSHPDELKNIIVKSTDGGQSWII